MIGNRFGVFLFEGIYDISQIIRDHALKALDLDNLGITASTFEALKIFKTEKSNLLSG